MASLLLLAPLVLAARAAPDEAPLQRWEVSRSASGRPAQAMCFRNISELSSIAHPGEQCRRSLLRREGAMVLIDVQCAGGHFARAEMLFTTPRSLRLRSSGIHHGQPFDDIFYARRAGFCPAGPKR